MSKIKKFDEGGNRLQVFPKGEYEVMTPEDPTNALLEIGIRSLSGRPPQYANTEKGLQMFQNRTIEYFRHLKTVNENRETEQRLLADVESWCAFLQITRQTLSTYRRTRGEAWATFIDRTKDIILAIKKDQAMRFKAPPMVFVFDAVNNHNYVNTNQVQLVTDQKAEESAQLEDDVAAAGLKWDAERGEYVVEDTKDVK